MIKSCFLVHLLVLFRNLYLFSVWMTQNKQEAGKINIQAVVTKQALIAA